MFQTSNSKITQAIERQKTGISWAMRRHVRKFRIGFLSFLMAGVLS